MVSLYLSLALTVVYSLISNLANPTTEFNVYESLGFFFISFLTLAITLEWVVFRRLKSLTMLNQREIKKLKDMENFRREFLGEVSHELKTPIFAVQGFIHGR